MGWPFFVVTGGILASAAVFGVAAFSGTRSFLVSVLGVPLAALFAGLAWYAFAETASMPWTIGYGSVSAVFGFATIRNWFQAPASSAG